jgi:P-type Ca2+ transporter type 2C
MTTPDTAQTSADAPQPPTSHVWHTLEGTAVVQALHTSPEEGLTPEDARRRLEAHGPNELTEAKRPGLTHMFLEQFTSFLVVVLLAAALISALLGTWIEAVVILAIVVLNAILGVVQEHRAEQAMAALRRLAAPEAHVVRGGHRQNVPARDLVPGDIVLLEAGNYIPADLRLIETANLHVEEAALTGESVPVEKDAGVVLRQDITLGDRRNTAFMGTLVTYGRGRGAVVSTGMLTQIGLIATMLQSVQQEATPLQRRLDQLGRVLGWSALAICGAVFLVGFMRGIPPLEMFIVAVSLAVAAVPEGLPAVVTVTLALGMREMIARHALIRRLSSVETLGSTTVICSDKTGTLTQNQMTVTRAWVDGRTIDVGGAAHLQQDGRDLDWRQLPGLGTALWVALLANDAVLEAPEVGEGTPRLVGDPTEAALLLAAVRAGADQAAMGSAYPRIQEVPFDSGRKRMTTIHAVRDPRPDDMSPFYDGAARQRSLIALKGAPDIVLGLCTQRQTADDQVAPMTDADREAVLQANHAMTQDALRVLAVAYRVQNEPVVEVRADEIERDLIFAGLFGMIDPPRPEVPAAVRVARRAGLRSVMITGDYPATARAIAEQIGLIQAGHGVTTGHDLDAMDDEALAAAVMRNDVYARVSPEHKTRIVEGLKANGEVVAMTGDGVNDAPALKRADIGIGMGITGTDVVKETADMVLTDDNYASIVAAVEQGRVIYSNIRKFVYYLLSCNVAELVTIFVAILAGLPSPLTAIQLLWLNLITDGAPALALGVEKGDPDIMLQKPRPPSEPIINRLMWSGIAVQTVAISGITLAAFAAGLHMEGGVALASTMAFTTLSTSELLRAFTSRSERYSLFKIGVFSNRTMVIAVAASLLLLLAVVYVPFLQAAFNTVPLGWDAWRLMLPLILIPSIVAEGMKWLLRLRAARRLRADVA